MARIVVTEFVRLVEVVQASGGADGFQHGGWVFAITRGAEGEQFKLEETLASEACCSAGSRRSSFVKAWPS